MKSCFIISILILALFLGGCNSDKKNVTAGDASGNTPLAGQGGQTNTGGQSAVQDSSTGTSTGDAAVMTDGAVMDGGPMDSETEDVGAVDSEPTQLPLPTGKYRVGLSVRLMTPGGATPNEADAPITPYTPFFTQIYYPVDPAYTGEMFELNSVFVQCGTPDQVLTHVYPKAAMVPGTERFPVVLFAPGMNGAVDMFVSILEDLASQGYVVVAFQPETIGPNMSSLDLPSQPTPCDTKEEWIAYVDSMSLPTSEFFDACSTTVTIWLEDAVHTLDVVEQLDQQDPAGIFTGRLDLEKVGMFGRSLGGASAYEACATDSRFKACENLDGTFYGEHFDTPLSSPLMIQVSADHDNMETFIPRIGYIDQVDTRLKTVWDEQSAPAYQVVISDIVHMSFVDANLINQHFIWSDTPAGDTACVSSMIEGLTAQCMTKEDQVKVYAGTLDPVRTIDISRAYTRAFFDKHLKGIDQDLLKGQSTAYPEVTLKTKNL